VEERLVKAHGFPPVLEVEANQEQVQELARLVEVAMVELYLALLMAVGLVVVVFVTAYMFSLSFMFLHTYCSMFLG